jgi:hypothetical protein
MKLRHRELMNMQLLNCWEIKKCGRQRGGKKVNELGECIASKGKVGHSCWAFAGTMCSDEIQGTYAKKIRFCTFCEVYEIYNRSRGNLGKVIKNFFSIEEKKYSNKILESFDDLALTKINIKSKKEAYNSKHFS